MPPVTHRLVTDVDAAFVQKIFDIPEREWEPNVKHYRETHDFRAALKALEWVGFSHGRTLRTQPAPLKTNPSDKASISASDISAQSRGAEHVCAWDGLGETISIANPTPKVT